MGRHHRRLWTAAGRAALRDGTLIDVTSHLSFPRSVMHFVADPVAAASWYARAFGLTTSSIVNESGYVWFTGPGRVEIGFHPADVEKNSGSGVVVYWQVESVEAVSAQLVEAGAVLHRGPLAIEQDRTICQLLDPFGNVIGLDGPP